MLNFEEKKPDMVEQEKKERQDLILMIKDSFNLFKLAFNEQTLKAERGAGVYLNETDVSADISDRSKAVMLNKSRDQPYKENETQQAMLEDSVAVQLQNRVRKHGGDFGLEFDSLVVKIVSTKGFIFDSSGS